MFWESLDPESVRSAGPHPHQRQQTDTAFWLQQFADVDSDPNGAAAAEDGVFDSDYLADLESEFGD
jgi:hypothetical protein